MAYPGYGGFGNMNPQMQMMGQANVYFGQPQYAASDPMWGYFTAVSAFSLETCRIMIAMLDMYFGEEMECSMAMSTFHMTISFGAPWPSETPDYQ